MSSVEEVPEHRRPGDSKKQIAEHTRGHLANLQGDVARMGLSESYFEAKVIDLAMGICVATGEEFGDVICGVLPAWRKSGFSDLADVYAEAFQEKTDQGVAE